MVGAVLLFLLGLGGFGAARVLRGSSPVGAIPPPSSVEVVAGIEKQKGPWGDLEISDIQIDPPDEYAARLYVPVDDGVWFFGAGYDRSKILSLFSSTDLTQSQQAELTDSARWQISAQGIRVTPEPATVFKLSSSARSRIYRALSEFPENYFQASPFMFSKRRANDWFFHSGLAAETVALISGLLYEHGGMLCFSDVGILSHISSDAEKTRLIMALSRTPTVLVNLRIPPGSDPAPLIRYWFRTGDGNGARQLINSVARERNGGSIDITHLLPAFVRDHVYTYPRASADQAMKGPDCFWSALSFDREVPDHSIVNEAYLIERLRIEYEATREPPQLGDVLTFSNSAGRIVHACVYIAGNVVFTKNGNTAFAPWVFMRIQDVAGIYSSDTAPKIICFRKKALKGS